MTQKSIKYNPFEVVRMFEEEVAEYTGAPYAVAVDSCTNAIFLACRYHHVDTVRIPKKTYLSVPGSIMHAGGIPRFEDRNWEGAYQLKPYPIWDAAKRFTSNMYRTDQTMCLSFHIKKLLPLGKGGMILTNDAEAVKWYKKARYEGRGEVDYDEDDITMPGWNMYMTPEEAARGLTLMLNYPEHVADLTENEGRGYKDLTEFSLYRNSGI